MKLAEALMDHTRLQREVSSLKKEIGSLEEKAKVESSTASKELVSVESR